MLKARKPGLQIVAVEPEASSVLSGGTPGPHKIQGIGAGFVPKILDTTIYDEIVTVSNEDAVSNARLVARPGRRAGRHLVGRGAEGGDRRRLAAENAGKNIVVIIPSFAERYLSTILFDGLG